MDKIDFFKANVKNAHLIDDIEGILPIEGNHIGQILINETDRTVLIEIKQCTKPQIIEYFEGHILCRDAEFEVITTDINGGVFILNKGKDNPSRYELQLNNNRQGIIIKCSEIELIDYRNIHKPIEEYKDIFIGCQFGKFFSIKYDKR
jgi:hypothetical protein